MESSEPRRVLIVANRTAATPTLLDAVKQYAREQPTTFALLVPDSPKSAHTDWTLELALPLLQRAAGGPVEGLTGTGGDPFVAIKSVVDGGNYDRIIVSTLPQRVSKWLRRDLPKRVASLGVPVEVITSESGYMASYMPSAATDIVAWGVKEDPRSQPPNQR